MKGDYRIGIPDAALAAGAKFVTIHLQGAANMAPCVTRIKLNTLDEYLALKGITAGGVTTIAEAWKFILANIEGASDKEETDTDTIVKKKDIDDDSLVSTHTIPNADSGRTVSRP